MSFAFSSYLEFLADNFLSILLETGWKYILPAVLLFALFTLTKGLFFWNRNRIQKREPKKKFILYELKWWSSTMVLALLVTGTATFAIEQDITRIYTEIQDYGWIYYFLSFLILLFIHDTYFYWVHKWIHHPKVYKYVHRVHHRSPTPTPFDGFAVTKTEALAELLFLPIIAFVLPLHYSMYLIFGVFYIIYNSYLHLGFEVLPKFWVSTPPFKYINTAVHHDQHHTMIRYNFGLYFNIWDRLMGTLNPDYNKLYNEVKAGREVA